MTTIHDLREQHGEVYVCETSDGLVIPWKPLSIGDFFEYERLFSIGTYSSSILEDEIFRKCVTDPALVKGIDRLKAGTVTTVVAAIMQHSGPSGPDETKQVMDISRNRAQQIHHKMVTLICQAFPYKPDELYNLDFNTFMLRLAQAEDKLISTGQFKEPLRIGTVEELQEEQKPKARRPADRADLNKLKRIYEARKEQEQTTAVPPVQSAPVPQQSDEVDYEPLNPHLTNDKGDIIISSAEMAEGKYIGASNHRDDEERIQAEQQIDTTIGDAKKIFKDYATQDKVQIKSHEERVKLAQERAERNKKAWDNYISAYENQQAKAVAEAQKIREERKAAKSSKRRKR